MQKLQALTQEQIQTKAPQVYTQAPFDGVSKNYTFLPTYQIVEDMEKLGWSVSDAKTMKSKTKVQKEFGKHMVTFFNPDIFIKDENGDIEAYPQVLIMNNHRGWGKFRFEIGVFRLICSNGLVIKEKDFGTFDLRHIGYSFEELKRLVDQAVEVLPKAVERINIFSDKIMSSEEQTQFATKALQARFGEEKLVDASEIDQILYATRQEDQGNNLWTIFNRVQEHLVHGGFFTVSTDKKERKVRAIKNMQADVELNQKLWEVAAEFC
jgi:hypothetical protein